MTTAGTGAMRFAGVLPADGRLFWASAEATNKRTATNRKRQTIPRLFRHKTVMPFLLSREKY
jgi:hypothetical protein